MKGFLSSKTIRGVLIAISPAIVSAVNSALGTGFTVPDVHLLVGDIETLVTIAGGLYAMYGRAVASQPLRLPWQR